MSKFPSATSLLFIHARLYLNGCSKQALIVQVQTYIGIISQRIRDSMISHTHTNIQSQQRTTNVEGTHHSQFDIYPEELVQVEARLQDVEDHIGALARNLCEEGNSARNGDIGAKQHIADYSTLGNQDQLPKQWHDGQHPNPKEATHGQRQKWEREDAIDSLARVTLRENINFYEQKLQESEERYNTMKHYYEQRMNELTFGRQKIGAAINQVNESSQSNNHPIDEGEKKQIEDDIKDESINSEVSNVGKAEYNHYKIEPERVKQGEDRQAMPQQYEQYTALQHQKQRLTQYVASLESQLSSAATREVRLAQLEAILEQKQETIATLNAKAAELASTIHETQGKCKQQQSQLGLVQEKLQQKQKELLKFIHSESNFAAQQLTTLESALLKEKDDSQSMRIEYERKINELEEGLRQVHFTYEKQKEELLHYKEMEDIRNHLEKGQTGINEQSTDNTSHEPAILLDLKQNQKQESESVAVAQSIPGQLKKAESSGSASSYMKKARHKFSISRVLETRIGQPRQDPSEKSSKIFEEMDTLLQQGKMEGQQDQYEDFDGGQQVAFTKVVSVKSNDPCEGRKKSNDSYVDMKIAEEILLVPVESMDQIEVGLNRLRDRLIQYKGRAREEGGTGKIKEKTQLRVMAQPQQPTTQPSRESGLKTTGYPIPQNKPQKSLLQIPLLPQPRQHEMESEMRALNEGIYQVAVELGQLCKAVINNFESQIISSQGEKIKETIKAKQQLNIQKPIQQKEGTIKDQKPGNLLPTQSDYKASGGEDQGHSHDQTSQEIMKLLDIEIKNLIKLLLDDERALELNEEEEAHSLVSCEVAEMQSLKQQQLQDDRSLLLVLQKLSGLNRKMDQRRDKILANKKESVQRLFDVIRSMIIYFKISFKSMKKIIDLKEAADAKKNKYMHLKLYLQSLYKVLEQENGLKHEPQGQVRSTERIHADEAGSASNIFTLYDNYQQKLEKLSSQLSKVRMELDYKTKQFSELKELATNQLILSGHKIGNVEQIRKNQQPQFNYAKEGSVEKKNEEQEKSVQKSNQKQKGDNDKHDEEEVEAQIQQMDVEEVRKQLATCRRRCYQLQQQSSQKKKKTQRIIFVRK